MRQIAVVQRGHVLFGVAVREAKQQATAVAEPGLRDVRQRRARMQRETVRRVGARDIGCQRQIDIHALRAVLKIPAAFGVAIDIAFNEADQRGMHDGIAGQIVVLRVLIAHAPAPASIERQPAVAMGNVWPFFQSPRDDFIHDGRRS